MWFPIALLITESSGSLWPQFSSLSRAFNIIVHLFLLRNPLVLGFHNNIFFLYSSSSWNLSLISFSISASVAPRILRASKVWSVDFVVLHATSHLSSSYSSTHSSLFQVDATQILRFALTSDPESWLVSLKVKFPQSHTAGDCAQVSKESLIFLGNFSLTSQHAYMCTHPYILTTFSTSFYSSYLGYHSCTSTILGSKH